MNIHTIANYLNQSHNSNEDVMFDCIPISGEIDVLQITIIGRDELPIFVSVADNQILCITYLWDSDSIVEGKKEEMMECMLEMNIPMPLSSFSKIGKKYVVFGALSIHSSLEDIEHELGVLNNNTIDVIDSMQEYFL